MRLPQWNTYLSDLLSLLFPLCAILVFFDCAEEDVELDDDDPCDVGSRPRRTVGTGARASTECAVMRTVRGVTDTSHDRLLRRRRCEIPPS
jgi:hypothetical protein